MNIFKKSLSLFLAALTLSQIVACTQANNDNQTSTNTTTTPTTTAVTEDPMNSKTPGIATLTQEEKTAYGELAVRNAERAHIDEQGRIAIKSGYREFANLKSEIVSVGRGEFVEIWNAQEFDKKQQSIDMNRIREILMKRGF